MSILERIRNFPISFFSVTLGMTGFTIAFYRAEHILNLPFSIHKILLGLTILVFLSLGFMYFIKVLKYRDEVAKEFNHPIKLSFFPTISISFLLISIAFLHIDMQVSEILWYIGAALQFALTMKILTIWIQHEKFEVKHLNPAWFIPAVGNIIVPIAGIAHSQEEISWFFYSIGIILWIVLFTIIWNRIIFHNPLPQKLLPTLFILIAPPAIGFVSLVKLTGEISVFGNILYYFALFMIALLFFQIKMFIKIKFFLSWWAYSFPIAAMTIATLLMYHKTGTIFFEYLAFALLAVLTIVIVFLLFRTLKEMKEQGICIEEE